MIQQPETYLKMCWRCKEKTPHSIYKLSKKRGAKLKCSKCNHFIEKYNNLNKLKPITKEVKDIDVKCQEEPS